MSVDKGHKWRWKMDFCRKNGLSPGEVWEEAEIAYHERNNEQDAILSGLEGVEWIKPEA